MHANNTAHAWAIIQHSCKGDILQGWLTLKKTDEPAVIRFDCIYIL